MKRILLFSACMAMATATFAQLEGTTYDFGGYEFMIEGYPTPVCGYFHHVSNNGKLAVGYDEELSGASYYWSLDNPDELVMVCDPSVEGYSTLNDATDDGVMAGSKETQMPTDEYVRMYPATYTVADGWKFLPVPDNYSVNQSWEYSSENNINCVSAVTPDGKYMAGQLYLNDIVDGEEDLSTIRLVPVLWENGELKNVFDGMGITQFMVYGISEDGSTIVGMNTSYNGGQNPAYIKDGQLHEVFNCDDEASFNGGLLSSIDADGNMYGYFMEGDGATTKYFKVGNDGKIVYYDRIIACAGGGYMWTAYGPMDADGNIVPCDGFGLYSVLDCSNDASVVCGGGAYSVGFGSMNCPSVWVSKDATTGISEVGADAVDEIGIDYNGAGTLYVNGAYDTARLYSAGGVLLQEGAQGDTFDMSALPAGTYIVKVKAGNNCKTFKLLR